MNVKELKVVIVNENIDENHYIKGYKNLDEMLAAINNYIEATEHILDDETSIYAGYNLEMIKNKITKEELLEIIEDQHACIDIAENKKDKGFCVYIHIDWQIED